MTHIFYCAWLKTQVEICVTGTLDMSQAPLRHKWKPGLKKSNAYTNDIMYHMQVYLLFKCGSEILMQFCIRFESFILSL